MWILYLLQWKCIGCSTMWAPVRYTGITNMSMMFWLFNSTKLSLILGLTLKWMKYSALVPWFHYAWHVLNPGHPPFFWCINRYATILSALVKVTCLLGVSSPHLGHFGQMLVLWQNLLSIPKLLLTFLLPQLMDAIPDDFSPFPFHTLNLTFVWHPCPIYKQYTAIRMSLAP